MTQKLTTTTMPSEELLVVVRAVLGLVVGQDENGYYVSLVSLRTYCGLWDCILTVTKNQISHHDSV